MASLVLGGGVVDGGGVVGLGDDYAVGLVGGFWGDEVVEYVFEDGLGVAVEGVSPSAAAAFVGVEDFSGL